MPVLIQEGRALLFVHIPKTGGATIESALRANGWLISHWSTSAELIRLRRCSPQHDHAELLERQFRLDRFDAVFTIVRDPLRRLQSEYCFRLPAGTPMVEACSSKRFGRWVRNSLNKVALDPYHMDNHLRPQVEFLLRGARVFRFEDGLEAIAESLAQAHSPGFHLGEIHRNRSPIVSSSVECDAETREFIYSHYADDYREFGYAPSWTAV